MSVALRPPRQAVINEALDEIEAGLHDAGTHAVATAVAWAVVGGGFDVSPAAYYRAEAILRAVGGGAR
jgi:hypothetical protein